MVGAILLQYIAIQYIVLVYCIIIATPTIIIIIIAKSPNKYCNILLNTPAVQYGVWITGEDLVMEGNSKTLTN